MNCYGNDMPLISRSEGLGKCIECRVIINMSRFAVPVFICRHTTQIGVCFVGTIGSGPVSLAS